MTKKDKDRSKEGGKARAEALDARLVRLEAALATLGGAVPAPDPGTGAGEASAGRIQLAVRAGETDWTLALQPETVLAADWAASAAPLAALGHPVRLAILRAALAGPVGTAALIAAAEVSTPGQFYHHLRELTAAGWLRGQARGAYAVPADRAGPLLAVLAAVGR